MGESFSRNFLAVQYVVNSRIYLLYYSPFSVSVKFVVVSTSDVVCTLGVELLAMLVVEMVVSSVEAIYNDRRVQKAVTLLIITE